MMLRRVCLAICVLTISAIAAGQQRQFQIPPDETPVQIPLPPFHAQLIETTELIRAREARNTFHVSGANLTAVILDTGIRETHSDFAGRIIAKRNFSTADSADPNIVTDRHGHGTNVAGIIGANGVHVGIAPGANLIVLKVLDDKGGGDFAAIDGALQWVLDNGEKLNVRVVNVSIGDGRNLTDDSSFATDSVRLKIAALRAKRVAVVVAAGNDYFRFSPRSGSAIHQGMSFPAALRETVSVGAVYDASLGGFSYQSGAVVSKTRADQICVFSQRLHRDVNALTRTDIFAPGAVLTSSGINDDSGESAMQGTSQAAPVVSGTILLMQEHFFHLTHTFASIDDIEDALRSGAVVVRDTDEQIDNVQHTNLAFERLDVVNALTAVQQKQHLALFKAELNIEPLPPPAVQKNLDWSIGNTGAPDCPLEYAAYPECLLPGSGRACLMQKAIASAKENDCSNAFRLSLITQCHNPEAQKSIAAAGAEAVCSYLRKK